MAILHTVAAFAEGGVSGLQATQSDWSPYIVHFTSYRAMTLVRSEFQAGAPPEAIAGLLRQADSASFSVVEAIARSGTLTVSSPAEKDAIPPCVCLTECVIGGLVSNAERYGRFGFVFDKSQLFRIGAAPCLYLGADEYAAIVQAFKNSDNPTHQRIYGRSNFMNPTGVGGKVQDYSHEREWRVFCDIVLADVPPRYLIAPSPFLTDVFNLFHGRYHPIPIDTMFEWGA